MNIEEVCQRFASIGRQKIERILKCAERHGSNRRAIARETGIKTSLVLKILKAAGIKTLHPHHHIDEAKLRRLHADGKTDDQIAEILEVPGPAVTTKRHRLHLPANSVCRWPELPIGRRQNSGFLEIAGPRNNHGRYSVLCHCPYEEKAHLVRKQVYGGHFNAGSVKSCGRSTLLLFTNSDYAKDRKAAAAKRRARMEELMEGMSFQTLVVVQLCGLGLRGSFRQNDRALLSGKEIDLVFPRLGSPAILVEINELNHESSAHRKRDSQKRDLAMHKYPDAEWLTISQKGFLENPKAEIDKLLAALQRKKLLAEDWNGKAQVAKAASASH